MKVLIVDDAKLMRSMIRNALKDVPDIVLLEASNGEEAVQLYYSTKPDVVTMDITMDLKNGVEAAKDILKSDPGAKIIMVTALGQEEMLKDCISAGVQDFIVKPFSAERIKAAVSKISGVAIP